MVDKSGMFFFVGAECGKCIKEIVFDLFLVKCDSMADPWHMPKNCPHKGHRMGFYVPYVDICHRSATIAFSSMQSKTAQAQGLVM